MDRPEPAERRTPARSRLWSVAAALSLSTVVGLAWYQGWLVRLADHDQVVDWMRQDGLAGPLICIGIQFLQVVIFAIPGEITQIAAGYVFGAWWGFLYSIIGISLGSAFDFLLARALGRPVVQRILGAERLAEVDQILRSRKGRTAVFVLFLLPGMPKDAMSYGAGLTGLWLPTFLALSVSARMPALLLSTLFGSEAHDGNYVSLVWITAAAVALVAGAAYYQWRRRPQ